MADISNVDFHEIKDLYESLESLSCKHHVHDLSSLLTAHSSYNDPRTLLDRDFKGVRSLLSAIISGILFLLPRQVYRELLETRTPH